MLSAMLFRHRAPRSVAILALLLGLPAAASCQSSSRPAQQPPPPIYGPSPGYAPPGQPPPYGGQPANPSAPPPANAPPAVALPPVLNDPVNNVDVNFLRGQAQVVLRELIAALSPANAQRVQGIPLVVEDKPGEVNAFAISALPPVQAANALTSPGLSSTTSGTPCTRWR